MRSVITLAAAAALLAACASSDPPHPTQLQAAAIAIRDYCEGQGHYHPEPEFYACADPLAREWMSANAPDMAARLKAQAARSDAIRAGGQVQ